jgi:hypothetical protein
VSHKAVDVAVVGTVRSVKNWSTLKNLSEMALKHTYRC